MHDIYKVFLINLHVILFCQQRIKWVDEFAYRNMVVELNNVSPTAEPISCLFQRIVIIKNAEFGIEMVIRESIPRFRRYRKRLWIFFTFALLIFKVHAEIKPFNRIELNATESWRNRIVTMSKAIAVSITGKQITEMKFIILPVNGISVRFWFVNDSATVALYIITIFLTCEGHRPFALPICAILLVWFFVNLQHFIVKVTFRKIRFNVIVAVNA